MVIRTAIYSRIRIYATRLHATFVYMQLFPGSQKVLKHCFSYGYMQLSRICNFFLVPEQLHITGFYCSYIYSSSSSRSIANTLQKHLPVSDRASFNKLSEADW